MKNKNTYHRQVSGSYGDGPKPPTTVKAAQAGANKIKGGVPTKGTTQDAGSYRKQVSGSKGG